MNKTILYDQLHIGFAKMQEERAKKEEGLPPRFRGGNSGCMVGPDCAIGADPRTVILRYLGIQIPTTFDEQIGFDLGYMNEEAWIQLLELGDVKFKREQDCPTEWEFDIDGQMFKVTGSPDIMIGDEKDGEFKPTLGIELKALSSPHKIVKYAHFGDAKPNTDNLVQSAHYSWQWGKLAWVLAYTQRGYPMAPSYAAKRWQAEHRALRCDDNGRAYGLGPFMSLYDLDWDGDVFMCEGKPTLITSAGIEQFYRYCAQCIINQQIPQVRSGGTEWDGSTVIPSKNDVLRFDDFKDAREDTWDHWIADCKEIAKIG